MILNLQISPAVGATPFVLEENTETDEIKFNQLKPQEFDDQMERYSETSSIELIIQGGSTEKQLNTSVPKIPESHMHLNFNPYPGIKNYNHVPVDIVKSFTPVSHSEPSRQYNGEIYSDYAQDPYNLTLQIDNDNKNTTAGTSSFFQSSSYFSNDSDTKMAPGSELFNRP